MTDKFVYQMDLLGRYIGTLKANESPLEPGVFLIPSGCVQVPPPNIPSLKAAYWDGQAWRLLDYFKGLIVFHTGVRTPLTLTGTGAIPDGYTTLRPERDQIWKKGRWVDALAAQLTKLYPVKLALINEGCTACGFHEHPATHSMNIWPPIPR